MKLITLTATLATTADWAECPDLVEIQLDPKAIPMIEATQAFMKKWDLHKVERWWGANYTFFATEDEDGEVIEKVEFESDYRVEGCNLVIYPSYIAFIFPFRHTNDELWTDQQWTVEQLKSLLT